MLPPTLTLKMLADLRSVLDLDELARFRATLGLPDGLELTGHCARTSAALVQWLAERGIEAELVLGRFADEGGHA